MKTRFTAALLPALVSLAFAGTAHAQIKVGVVLSTTGPAASMGIAQKNTIALLPKQVGGQSVEYIVLDDASDTTSAVKNTRKLVSENKVDLIIGSTTTPNSMAMEDIAAESGTPMITMAASASLVDPMDAKRKWTFKTPQNDAQMASAIVEHMAASGIKTVSFIGFSDSYGEGWYREFARQAEAHKIRIVANERFARNDTSVTGQVLKMIAARPDAMLVAGAGTPAALPQKTLKERGYKGSIYQTHGAANSDFLRVCGKDCEGTFLPAGPMLVAEQLPASSPVKQSGMAYKTAYEKAYGAGSVATFGGHAWDAGLLIANAVPAALKAGQPGTAEFRKGLRDAIEGTKDVTGAHGIFNLTPTDHVGLDQRSRVMVRIADGKWQLASAGK
jgi:branched-chain amino acid transport system substrate-binding protein